MVFLTESVLFGSTAAGAAGNFFWVLHLLNMNCVLSFDYKLGGGVAGGGGGVCRTMQSHSGVSSKLGVWNL